MARHHIEEADVGFQIIPALCQQINASLTDNNKQLGFVQNSDRIASVSSRVEGGSLFREPTPGPGKLFFASVLDDRRALDPIRLTRNELHCQFLSRQSHSANRRLDCPSL